MSYRMFHNSEALNNKKRQHKAPGSRMRHRLTLNSNALNYKERQVKYSPFIHPKPEGMCIRINTVLKHLFRDKTKVNKTHKKGKKAVYNCL